MKTFREAAVNTISYFFILLFCYAAISKILDFENFQVQLAQSPLLSAYAGFISYGVIVLEVGIAAMLSFSNTRKVGLQASFGLMMAFTAYIFLILNYSDFIPCSCGGILEKMGWTEHLVFNGICVVLSILAVVIMEKERAIPLQRTLAGSIFIVIISGGGMVALFLSSEQFIKKENNFTRRFIPHPIIEEGSHDLKVNSYYFAGSFRNNIYLGNLSSPLRLLRLDDHFRKIDTIAVRPSTLYKYRHLWYKVRGEILYAYDGSVPVIYETKLDSLNYPLREISSKEIYFDQMEPISRRKFMMRVEDHATQRTALATLTVGIIHEVHVNDSILTRKADGGFDADGQLLYDGSRDEAYYLFYYRNQILKISAALKVSAQMKTIDTIARAQFRIKNLKDGRIKMMERPLLVNRNMTVHGGLIFNHANLTGIFESKAMWQKNAVVDVYQTTTARYWGSFYVQDRGVHRMSQMLVTDSFFYILSGNEIIRYRCAQTLTDHFLQGRSRKPPPE